MEERKVLNAYHERRRNRDASDAMAELAEAVGCDKADLSGDIYKVRRGRPPGSGRIPLTEAEKRAHHNAFERKRRDHIKDSFTSLRESVPALQGGKASREKTLKKAAEYIRLMSRKNNAHPQDIDDIRRQNNVLKAQIRLLEKERTSGNLLDAHELGIGIQSEGSSDDTDSSDGEGTTRRVEKLKINSTNS